jgi:hypothetical protein
MSIQPFIQPECEGSYRRRRIDQTNPDTLEITAATANSTGASSTIIAGLQKN